MSTACVRGKSRTTFNFFRRREPSTEYTCSIHLQKQNHIQLFPQAQAVYGIHLLHTFVLLCFTHVEQVKFTCASVRKITRKRSVKCGKMPAPPYFITLEVIASAEFWPRPEEAPQKPPRIERKISLYQKKSLFLTTRLAKDYPKVRKGLPKVCWGLNKHTKDSGSRVSATRLFRSYGHFVMTYPCVYSKLYSTADKERSESQKGRSEYGVQRIKVSYKLSKMKSALT